MKNLTQESDKVLATLRSAMDQSVARQSNGLKTGTLTPYIKKAMGGFVEHDENDLSPYAEDALTIKTVFSKESAVIRKAFKKMEELEENLLNSGKIVGEIEATVETSISKALSMVRDSENLGDNVELFDYVEAEEFNSEL